MTVDAFDPREVIEAKKAGRSRPDAIADLVTGLLEGTVDDAQVAAYLMAGILRGFTEDEAVAMTEALLRSGEVVDLGLAGPTVDKHSTGGVGDTTTLVVAPLAAACGLRVAKLSGRGLGHTGGTIDKLESIPGMRVDLTTRELRDQLDRVGLAVAAATSALVPADRVLYALRDRTATVDAPALIAASVMSKKLAGGADTIILDVKTGDGAFLSDIDDAVALAELCVAIGTAHGRRTAALVTDMSQPLGRGVGNALEVAEAITTLAQAPADDRLATVSRALATALVQLARGAEEHEARAEVDDAWTSGAALDRLAAFIDAQGGDPRVIEDPWSVLERAPVVEEWRPGAGTVASVACRALGELAHRLGAGRLRADDPIDHAVGLEVLVGTGDRLGARDVAVRVHARTEEDAAAVLDRLPALIELADVPVTAPELIHARVGL